MICPIAHIVIRTRMCSIRSVTDCIMERSVTRMHRFCAQCSVRDAVDVSVDVINESSYTIHESVQAYIQHEEADAYEPGYQLKGIQTVTLQPKETKRVTISLKARDFAIITQEGECVVRPGSYRIAIGGQQPDARSAKLTGSDVAALVVRREGAQTPVEY